MTLKMFALKQPCVSMHVSSSFTCSFQTKIIQQVLNSIENIFVLETSRKTSPRTTQGSLRKEPFIEPKLPKKAQPTIGNQRLMRQSTPRWKGSVNWELCVGEKRTNTSLSPRPWTQQDGPLVKERMSSDPPSLRNFLHRLL